MAETRIPMQKRSIEKRDKILKKGFALMCQNGYHNVSTVDIAKEAGVSTGIIYQYFIDKKEIFTIGAKKYADEIMFPIFSLIDEHEKLPANLNVFFRNIIKVSVKGHQVSKRAHQELTAMQHLDEDIEKIFKDTEIAFSNKLYNLFVNNGYKKDILKEKMHLVVNLVDNLAHEKVYHRHLDFDYEAMETIVVNVIMNILDEK